MKIRLSTLAVTAALASLAGQVHAAPQRWNVDVLGLSYQYNDAMSPYSVHKLVDVHGYFTGEDLDHDGAISLSEVIEIKLPGSGIPDYPYANPFPQSQWGTSMEAFHYAPADGLTYKGSELYLSWEFGRGVFGGYRYGSNSYTWTSDTHTTITAVPEPSAWVMAVMGLSGLGLLIRRANPRIAQSD